MHMLQIERLAHYCGQCDVIIHPYSTADARLKRLESYVALIQKSSKFTCLSEYVSFKSAFLRSAAKQVAKQLHETALENLERRFAVYGRFDAVLVPYCSYSERTARIRSLFDEIVRIPVLARAQVINGIEEYLCTLESSLVTLANNNATKQFLVNKREIAEMQAKIAETEIAEIVKKPVKKAKPVRRDSIILYPFN